MRHFRQIAHRNSAHIKSIAGSALATALLAGGVGVMAGVPASASAADITPNADAGREIVSNCVGCHSIPGYKSSFPTVYAVPMIAGQAEKYLVNALVAYRKGDRDHPTMRAIAGSLTDQNIADLAAYFANFNK